jgi:hypothetical protein
MQEALAAGTAAPKFDLARTAIGAEFVATLSATYQSIEASLADNTLWRGEAAREEARPIALLIDTALISGDLDFEGGVGSTFDGLGRQLMAAQQRDSTSCEEVANVILPRARQLIPATTIDAIRSQAVTMLRQRLALDRAAASSSGDRGSTGGARKAPHRGTRSGDRTRPSQLARDARRQSQRTDERWRGRDSSPPDATAAAPSSRQPPRHDRGGNPPRSSAQAGARSNAAGAPGRRL